MSQYIMRQDNSNITVTNAFDEFKEDTEEKIDNLSNFTSSLQYSVDEFKENTEEKIDNLSNLTSSLQGSVKILNNDSFNLKYKTEMLESRIAVLESSTKLWKVVNIVLIIFCLILGFIR